MTFCTDIHGRRGRNLTDFSDPLNLHLPVARPLGFWLLVKYLDDKCPSTIDKWFRENES